MARLLPFAEGRWENQGVGGTFASWQEYFSYIFVVCRRSRLEIGGVLMWGSENHRALIQLVIIFNHFPIILTTTCRCGNSSVSQSVKFSLHSFLFSIATESNSTIINNNSTTPMHPSCCVVCTRFSCSDNWWWFDLFSFAGLFLTLIFSCIILSMSWNFLMHFIVHT